MNGKQTALGNGNFQLEIGNVFYGGKDICDGIGKLLKELDDKVNALFPRKIRYSKFSDYRDVFSCSKIFSSLVKVEVPFGNALHIVYLVAEKIIEEVEVEGKYQDEFSTHDIRKIVSTSILNYRINDVSSEEIERWGDRYIRRYGHDGQRVKVYSENFQEDKEVGYKFVKDILIEDILFELEIRKNVYREEISQNQISSICEEIISFVNNCNMYRIDYNILKQYIVEMSLQPPHPWFVTEKTKDRICEYDLQVLNRHYLRLLEAKESRNYEELYYVILEALHHSCSSILARYNEVLGSDNLDVFYRLERIVSYLYETKSDDLLIENYIANRLPSDLKYVDESLKELYNILKNIKKKLIINGRICIIQDDFLDYVIQLCEIAQKLGNNTNKKKIELFLKSDWSEYSSEERRKNIKRVFDTISGVGTRVTKDQSSFWIKDIKEKSDKDILVIFYEDDIVEKQIYNYIKSKIASEIIKAIFIVNDSEESVLVDQLKQRLSYENYFVEIINRQDIQTLFSVNNSYAQLHNILDRNKYFLE